MRGKYDNDSGCESLELAELMRAIILRAIEDLKKGGEVAEDAKAFLFSTSPEDEEYPFSFSSICAYLGINEELTRQQIYSAYQGNIKISTRRRSSY